MAFVAGLGGFLTCYFRQGVARFGAAAAFMLLSAAATTANAKEPLGLGPANGFGVDPDVTGAALQARGTSLPQQMTQACDRGSALARIRPVSVRASRNAGLRNQ
jgi:hypothetical protein